jgi:hypothetical protein
VPQPLYVPPAFFAGTPQAAALPLHLESPPAQGGLFLDVQPLHAQIFIDGYYVGTPVDLDTARRGLILEAGPHSIEITAPGFQPVSFNVRIAPNESVAYRHALVAVEPAPAAPPPTPSSASASPTQVAPAKPTTFYLIPGCYMGNVPPKDARLPATCDLSKAVVLVP